MARSGFRFLQGKIENYVDRRHRGRCIYCGVSLFGQKKSRDHVPTKALLDKPYPKVQATIPTCVPCNNSFAADEEWAGKSVKTLPVERSERLLPNVRDVDRMKRICLKNARAHVFYEAGEPHYDNPAEVFLGPVAAWSEESVIDFLNGADLLSVWCEVGSRWNTRVAEKANFDEYGFLIIQPDVYRFRIEEGGRGVSMIFRERFLSRVLWEQ